MTPSYRGLTWDHPRGYNPLAAAAAEVAPSQGLTVSWDRQPLEGFESHPIADLCARYDLVVLDHPHVGEAVEANCLRPIESVLSAADLGDIAAATIGPCLASYRYAGSHWALPLDAASQVMAYRPDLCAPVGTWHEVRALSRKGKVGMSLAGPHAFLTLLSIATSLGDPPAEADPTQLLDPHIGTEAVDLLGELVANSPASIAGLNPIGILGHMSWHDDVHLVPLIYGYVNYTRPAPSHRAIAFADAPRAAANGRPGSTLGGTGIGISTRCTITPELVTHLKWLLGSSAQSTFIPRHDGQPSRRDAWDNVTVNADWPHFYRATRATLETAYIRPRYAGYIAAQRENSAHLARTFSAKWKSREIVDHLNATHEKSIGSRQR